MFAWSRSFVDSNGVDVYYGSPGTAGSILKDMGYSNFDRSCGGGAQVVTATSHLEYRCRLWLIKSVASGSVVGVVGLNPSTPPLFVEHIV